MRKLIRYVFAAFLTSALTGATPLANAQNSSPNPLAELLRSGEAAFGVFSGDKTDESARRWASDDGVDFVFYDMESGPFDVEGMKRFTRALGGRPIATRLPPIGPMGESREQARQRTGELIQAGVQAVVFPHVEDRSQAQLAVSALGAGSDRDVLGILIIEDRVGIENAREIVSTEGMGVVFPGPGDLRRAYEGDAEAVENAIQTVLAACKEFEVVCGITAGPGDVEKRLSEGFRVIIVTDPEALPIGRKAAGRR